MTSPTLAPLITCLCFTDEETEVETWQTQLFLMKVHKNQVLLDQVVEVVRSFQHVHLPPLGL